MDLLMEIMDWGWQGEYFAKKYHILIKIVNQESIFLKDKQTQNFK